MRLPIILAVTFLIGSAAAQTARDYYRELYAAGGLDRFADEYVCFQDDTKAQAFFIFGKSDTLRDFLQAEGRLSRLSKKQQADLKRGFVIVRGYDKGVAWSENVYLDKDGDSWISEKGAPINNEQLRVRFTVNWQTLRYKYSAEILAANGSLRGEDATYGRCELIPPGVRQKAGPN